MKEINNNKNYDAEKKIFFFHPTLPALFMYEILFKLIITFTIADTKSHEKKKFISLHFQYSKLAGYFFLYRKEHHELSSSMRVSI